MNKIKFMICAFALFTWVNTSAQILFDDFGTQTLTEGTDWADGDLFMDAGGAAGCYSNNANGSTTLCPAPGGTPVSLEFTYVDMETRTAPPCWDFITISDANGVLFNGCGEDGPDDPAQVGCSGTPDGSDGGNIEGGPNDLNAPTTFTSTGADGCLTVAFTSDSSVPQRGWVATASSMSAPPPPPAGVPTMGQWGLIILGLMLLIAGTVFVMKTKENTVVEA